MSSPFDAESESDPDAVATGRFSAAAPWGLDEQLADLEQDISGGGSAPAEDEAGGEGAANQIRIGASPARH